MSVSNSSSESDFEALQLLSDWDTDSDSDDESLTIQRTGLNFILELNDADFTYRFRLTKSAVSDLLKQIYPFLKTTSSRNNGISPINQLLLTLRFYALGTMLVSVADYVGVSIPSACRIVGDVSNAIAQLYDCYVQIVEHTQDLFYHVAGFPQVHGTIDCTHILIQSPDSKVQEEFRNMNGTFSLNVQAVCNADLTFLNIEARWPGSTHDANIFDNSVLRSQCESGILENRWLLGDSAYPCRSYLLTPIINPITRREELYNEAHIKTHNTIERCFGVWKRRFPILSMKIRLSLPKTQSIIIATAVLHNICRKHNINEVEPEVEISTQQPWVPIQTQETFNHERHNLINNYFGNQI